MYNIYVNDSHVYLFADDTKMYQEISTRSDCEKLQENI